MNGFRAYLLELKRVGLIENIDKIAPGAMKNYKEAFELGQQIEREGLGDVWKELYSKPSKIDDVKSQLSEEVAKRGKVGSRRDDVIVEAAGPKGNWNKTLNKPLKPDAKYQVDNYLYETDELSRVRKVTGELEATPKGRNEYQQRKSVKIKDGVKREDQGGHLIAQIFNGPGEQINYLPQKGRELNQGAWRDMERIWERSIYGTPPKKVEVNIRPIFEGTSKRPVAFEVDYWIDGVKKSEFFEN